jgi:Arc/MetJ family transcription regulator
VHGNKHHTMMQVVHNAYGMRTTLALDDDLLAEAQRLTGVQEKTLLVRAGLQALIERESARRLARLGGTQPGLAAAPRRRAAAR